LKNRTPLDKDESQEQNDSSNLFFKKEEKKKKSRDRKRKKTFDNPVSSERKIIKEVSYTHRSGISMLKHDIIEDNSNAQYEKEL
jgi:hypothetical protein